MKTLFFTLFSFIALCVNAQDIKNINTLRFRSTIEYEQLVEKASIDELRNIDGFESYQSLETTFPKEEEPPKELDQELPDDDYDISNDAPDPDDKNDYAEYGILGKLLSTDKTIIIGNWIIKVDLENEKAYILNTKNASEYNDVLNGNTSNPNVLGFSTEDDGIEILNQLDKGVAVEALRYWCDDRHAKRHKDDKLSYNGKRKRLNMKVVYQKAFIYFSLQGKAKCQKRFLRIWWKDHSGSARMRYVDLRYIPRCSAKISFNFQGDPNGQPGFGGMVKDQPECIFRAYESSRGLKNYTYIIDFISLNHGSGHVGISDY